jgi:hypothetical protein
MKKITAFVILTVGICTIAIAQQEDKTASLNIEGQIAVTTNGKAGFLNIGGPAIKFSFTKFTFSLNMLPSLKYELNNPKPAITPILGAGPQLYLLKKRLVLSFPCYYNTIKVPYKWTITAGIGYVLTKPKK